MTRPRKGQEIRYTEAGAKASKPSMKGEILGVVISVNPNGICTVETSDGEHETFICEFSNGYNNFFEWDGKDG